MFPELYKALESSLTLRKNFPPQQHRLERNGEAGTPPPRHTRRQGCLAAWQGALSLHWVGSFRDQDSLGFSKCQRGWAG